MSGFLTKLKGNIRKFPIKHDFDSDLKSPLKKLDEIVSGNMQKTQKYEAEPLTYQIFDFFDIHYQNSSKQPSVTDKMLAATAVTASLRTKKPAVILSNDGDFSTIFKNRGLQTKQMIKEKYPNSNIRVYAESIFHTESRYIKSRWINI